ncbi:hypothetical protein KQX54_020428 [Cotesia glomerata]|uniref:Uncharacterized protein n=1 Tax=Cotesia glomerata TaxID=32391 RepID=A0AAV7I4N0_COTGL|nr:hypothetical protein KQX54_020428 [Cotesia glomerata]
MTERCLLFNKITLGACTCKRSIFGGCLKALDLDRECIHATLAKCRAVDKNSIKAKNSAHYPGANQDSVRGIRGPINIKNVKRGKIKVEKLRLTEKLFTI